jgi:phosphohistidine phosphatase
MAPTTRGLAAYSREATWLRPLSGTIQPAMPSKRLVLVRHAKSSWTNPDLADHDRPLNARGRDAATAVGQFLHGSGVRPDLVLCSSATRARQTLERLHFEGAAVVIEDDLYGAGASALLTRVLAVPNEVHTLAVIAHNPGIEDLARLLADQRDDLEAAGKFPTGAVADLEFAIDAWAEVAPGQGQLRSFVVPRALS